MPARRCLFSSSSSATRRSRCENWAFLLSREFWAAIRLRCARASLRSSGVMSERERLRGGQSEGDEGGEYAESGVAGSCSTTKAESADRFMVASCEKVDVESTWSREIKERAWSCMEEVNCGRTWRREEKKMKAFACAAATYLTRLRPAFAAPHIPLRSFG